MASTPGTDQPPRAVPRPQTVRWAVAAQLALVALLVTAAVGAVLGTIRYDDLVTEAARNVGADSAAVAAARGSNVVGAVLLTGVCALLAVWFAALTVPVWRGRNVARILTTVGAGSPLLCGIATTAGGFLLLPLAIVTAPEPDAPLPEDVGEFSVEGEALYAELNRLSADEPWYTVGPPAIMLLVFATLVVLVSLLYVPPSNSYFRPAGARTPVLRPGPPATYHPGYAVAQASVYPVYQHPGAPYVLAWIPQLPPPWAGGPAAAPDPPPWGAAPPWGPPPSWGPPPPSCPPPPADPVDPPASA